MPLLRVHSFHIEELHRFSNAAVDLPGGLYWNPLEIFNQTCIGLRLAFQREHRVDGVANDSWGVDFGILDQNGVLLEYPRHYRDKRTRGVPEQVFETIPRSDIFGQTGVQVMDLNSLYQLYATHRSSRWVLEHAANLLFIPNLITYFLSGVQCSDQLLRAPRSFMTHAAVPLRKKFCGTWAWVPTSSRIWWNPGLASDHYFRALWSSKGFKARTYT